MQLTLRPRPFGPSGAEAAATESESLPGGRVVRSGVAGAFAGGMGAFSGGDAHDGPGDAAYDGSGGPNVPAAGSRDG